uniref:Translational repressor ifet-1 n=1 Tax=Phallusia mammillata TaxID=59560 RepID=A0A6F9DBP5_9ASCI|nr:translational repressor ifet-1 [Phallusia mammillata]
MNELKKILMISSEENEKRSRVTYSKETLLILSKNAPCQATPSCLLADFVGEDGYWDPESWHQSFSVSSIVKEKPAENVDEPAQSGLVLGPQRRSFQGGCHVRSQPSVGKTYQSNAKTADGNSSKYSRQQSHQDHDQHGSLRSNGSFEDKSNWNVDFKKKQDHNSSENHRRFKDYNKTSYLSSKKRTSERRFPHGNINESEPEWISYGPSSKFDTIELQGFEEADDFSWMGKEIPMDDVPTRKKKVEDNIPEFEADADKSAKTNSSSAVNLSENNLKATEQSDIKEEPKVISQTNDTKEESQEMKSRFSKWFDQQQKEIQETDILSAIKPTTSTTSSSNTSTSSTDVHETDAFNRLIASIKATDKVKEQMQQRNQQIQALQSIMNVTKSQKNDECVHLSSLEVTTSDSGVKPISHSKDLKKQLEMQKNVYQLKKRQIEQQQKSTLQMLAGDKHTSYSMSKVKTSTHLAPATVTDERALATASLAAKLAVKSRKNEFPGIKINNNEILAPKQSTSSVPLAFESLSQDQSVSYISAPSTEQEKKPARWEEGVPPKNTFHQHESALLIAQMLAKAGVTEEQLKQLTFDQQELIISMVQNQFSRKDILKLVNIDPKGEYSGNGQMPSPHQSTVHHSSIPTVRTNRAKESLSQSDKVGLDVASAPNLGKSSTLTETTYQDGCLLPSETVSAPYNHPTMIASRPVPSRVFNHTVLPVHPAMISPVVPHIVASNIAHPILPPVNQSALSHVFQPTAGTISQPHPAFLLHMQQRMYASQVAQQQQQQQQQAVMAAIHQQRVASGKISDNVSTVKNLGAETARPEETFKNPLSQWFSREVLKHSQFPPTPVDAARLHSPSNVQSNTEQIMHTNH